MVSYKDMNSRPIIVVALPQLSLLNEQLVIALPSNRFSCPPLSDKKSATYLQCFGQDIMYFTGVRVFE